MRLPEPQADRRVFDVKMTPMIDVVFLLLIFFVCTASFQIAEAILPIHLRAAGSTPHVVAEPPEPERLIVRLVATRGRVAWFIQERLHETFGQVHYTLSEIAAVDASLVVILDIDGAVPMSYAVDLYDACRAVGLLRIQFAASVDLE